MARGPRTVGYTYPDYTYSRNVAYHGQNGFWDAGAVNYATNTTSLRAPWIGSEIAAGTAVRNATSGVWYHYAGLCNATVPNS